MNTPTPTPRTDAATYPADCLGTTLVTHRDCSRALETELTALTAERDQLRAENERLRRAYVRPDDIRAQLESVSARAERADAELATERARLDYLQEWGFDFLTRAAIDAAMKEGAK
jgi:hypothetical protein